MKKLLFLCLATFASISLFAQSTAQQSSILREIFGDLDKDGIDEKIVVSNIPQFDENGSASPRRLTIYKKNSNNWNTWIQSDLAILGEDEGGVAGDPFSDIEVKKGILIIHQAGGSNWKWSRVDKYRFQNGDLQLIGYTGAHGMLCQEWTDIDYNLSTGDIEIKKDLDDCESGNANIQQEKFNHKLPKISIKERNKVEYNFKSPKYGFEVFL